jgi:hypothetical protein
MNNPFTEKSAAVDNIANILAGKEPIVEGVTTLKQKFTGSKEDLKKAEAYALSNKVSLAQAITKLGFAEDAEDVTEAKITKMTNRDIRHAMSVLNKNKIAIKLATDLNKIDQDAAASPDAIKRARAIMATMTNQEVDDVVVKAKKKYFPKAQMDYLAKEDGEDVTEAVSVSDVEFGGDGASFDELSKCAKKYRVSLTKMQGGAKSMGDGTMKITGKSEADVMKFLTLCYGLDKRTAASYFEDVNVTEAKDNSYILVTDKDTKSFSKNRTGLKAAYQDAAKAKIWVIYFVNKKGDQEIVDSKES